MSPVHMNVSYAVMSNSHNSQVTWFMSSRKLKASQKCTECGEAQAVHTALCKDCRAPTNWCEECRPPACVECSRQDFCLECAGDIKQTSRYSATVTVHCTECWAKVNSAGPSSGAPQAKIQVKTEPGATSENTATVENTVNCGEYARIQADTPQEDPEACAYLMLSFTL